MSGAKSVRIGEMEFWRFLFSIIIVFHHSRNLVGNENAWFFNGAYAVEFFFILSGFLLMQSIDRMKASAGSIGKDTRRSSYMLESSIVAGLTASGADAYILHVTTSITYVTRQDEFDCGVMITASHNPFYDNGIKIINRFGEKLNNATAALIKAAFFLSDVDFFDKKSYHNIVTIIKNLKDK